MIHRIAGYLFYQTERLARRMDTGIYSWNAPLLLGVAFNLYTVDGILAFFAVAGGSPVHRYVGSVDTVLWGVGICCVLQHIVLYAYYHYKRRHLRIRQDKSYGHSSSMGAVVFFVLPLVALVALGSRATGQ